MAKFKIGDKVSLVEPGPMNGLTGIITEIKMANENRPVSKENYNYYLITLDNMYTADFGATFNKIGRDEQDLMIVG